jgi:NADH-quinone oxidoreductase subunit M
MGYVILGLFALNTYGVTGAVYQMLNHGISTGALFLLVGMIYERTHSREISRYGGLAAAMPVFTVLFIIVTLSSIAVPGTNGFVGELLILLGAFAANKGIAAIAVTGVVLGAAYMLWMVKRVFFGEAGELVKKGLTDLNTREIVVMAPLIVLIVWMGVLPGHFLNWSEASINHLSKNIGSYELTVFNESNTEIKVVEATK